jgi:hypothetical protein
MHVHRGGVGIAPPAIQAGTQVAISVGLAGGLSPDIAPGTVVVATGIARAGENPVNCDADWTDALLHAAQRSGLASRSGPIVTVPKMVTGEARTTWAQDGFIAADMESALLLDIAPRVAVVRVILDAPHRELSPRWRTPARAALDPRLWSEAAWLVRHAPAYARRAAAVLAAAVDAAHA